MSDITEGSEGTPQVSPVESEAREQGWVPKEEFKGDAHKWVDAGEFIRRGELFAKIESQNKKLKSVEDTLAQFKAHHDKVQENAYKKALADLRAKKKEALVEGDADKVIAVDEQIDAVKEEASRAQAQARQPVQQEEHPEFVSFKQKNSWYESNKSMRAWADARGTELAQNGMSPADVLRAVTKEVREEFPNRFENPNRSKPSAVEGSSARGTSNRSEGSDFTPNETEKMLARKFVREKLFKNEAEYYAELSKLKS